MRAARSAPAVGVVALLITLLASPSAAQYESGGRAPSIRVYSQNGAIASNYITPAIEVSEDAYVFAVSLDLDGQIQILHPDFPGISVRILQHRQLRLPNFFAGFGRGGGTYDGGGRYVSYSDYYVGRDNDSRGTVIALASRAPFNLERVESDGDWNISAIRRLIENRAPASAAHALAAYLGAKGESIGTDYMRFASAQYHNYYASNALYACDLYYGGYSPGLSLARLATLNRVAQMRHGGRSVSIVGYDFCGMPIVVYGPSQPYTRYNPSAPPRSPGDTLGGKNRVSPPRSGRPPAGAPRAAAIGIFPITRRAEPPQMGDVTITAPRPNRRDPREIFNDLRNQARNGGSPERSRIPVERSAPRAETPVIGTPPVREYSKPIFREAPPQRSEPPRGPDRSNPSPAPAPIVHEQPSRSPPPPPRTQSETRMKPTPNPVPPPKH
ncbi:MAG TPA: hypothetical protein VGQ98_03075 [Gemmatimonadaceae bacterium]|nr:hypothetical protein [Gemmatimonadaceae bacterium]